MKHIFLAILAAVVFLFIPEAHAAGKYTVQLGSFKTEGNAQDLVSKLKDKKYSCDTRKDMGLVKVFCGSFDSKDEANALSNTLKKKGFGSAFVTTLPSESAESSSEAPTEKTEGVAPPVVTSPVSAPLAAATAGATAAASAGTPGATSDEQPVEQKEEDEGMSAAAATPSAGNKLTTEVEAREKETDWTTQGSISGDVFGNGGQYLHPFLSLTAAYTDNVFNANKDQDKKDDYIYTISPGFWLSLPASDVAPKQPVLSVRAPGGSNLTSLEPDTGRKLNAHLYYRGDAEEHSEYPSEDVVNHTAEGKASYDTLHGIYISLADQYVKSHEDRSPTLNDKRNMYANNRAGGSLVLGKGRRVALALGYTVYNVKYDNEVRNGYRERLDNQYTGSLSLKVMPKTRLFVGYEYTVVNYKENILPDSKEAGYFAGIRWEFSGKTSGIISGGQSVKKFEDKFNLDDEKTTSGQVQIDYTPTSKTRISVSAARAFKESDMQFSPYIVTDTGHVALSQRITHKITADLGFIYTRDAYKGKVLIGTMYGERTDKTSIVNASLKWDITKWNSIAVGYIYKQRDSNFDVLDYKVNMGFLRLSAMM